ncbi:MAG TPA: TetR/AcrR family transcriptional regulator [Polyangiaceae bacterium]
MARRRFEALPRERQDEILRLAAQEFASHGFQGTSYNQLLERLQLGKSSAYYYFDDKRDLFLTVVERCYAAYLGSIEQLAPPTSADEFWSFVEQSSLAGFRFMLRDPTSAALMQCMDREQALLGELSSERVLHDQAKFYETLLEQGQRLGAVRVDLPLALLADVARSLAISFDRWFVVEWYKPGFMGLEAAAKAFCDAARRVCEPAGKSAG